MLLGVVSDTHNNIKNVKDIIDIFNTEKVDVVVHTGDISKPETLKEFSDLNCPMLGVFGNNDRIEKGLIEVCEEFNFDFRAPPFSIKLADRNIAIFHEPDLIESYVKLNLDLDLILHGHTHRYRKETINKITYFNPGESAGFIKGKNALGIIDLKDLNIRRVFF
ncbi:MAG: hypothetical protein CMG57_09010 [Candidatus Marinimicrobia bacterium]|nr:hypothetical protein [Candidatus Neomarinimicrobiota bacterium]|tara:strand:+ start:1182 stop:1673 length:492 start_codon:yes stop_codon:yes gene_type:complete